MLFGVDTSPSLSVAARTDRGNRRELNEDALFAADPCFIVADGMGGHEFGAAASKAAISAFSEQFTGPGEASVRSIEQALDEARSRVGAISARSERGAGCTLTGAIRIQHEGVAHWYVLNIGDSRVYLQRGNQLRQLTVDHSLRSERLAEGDQQGAATPRNIITRALGSDDDRHDAWLLPLETGSRLLVCSDGLTSELDDDELNGLLAAGGRTDSVVDELIRRALASGGRDNVTAILVDIVSGGVPMPVPEDDLTDGQTIEITRPRVR
ncbi:MAG: serine/threonine-protein phosphatase [Leucobacter sp.]|nr:serine/threonine-protein phosphatase [Leucobacter sp.]